MPLREFSVPSVVKLLGMFVFASACAPGGVTETSAPARQTEVSIVGDQFYINGRPTYEGRSWNGRRIEGLLFNSRMVQGIFDDLNPETRDLWAYPDTRSWDAERNTREFVAAMPEWREHGLLSFTINLQGGSPQGYSREQPWHNSAIGSLGNLRPEYMARLERILDRADELGMVPILGLFYFGQDERLRDEAAVIQAVATPSNGSPIVAIRTSSSRSTTSRTSATTTPFSSRSGYTSSSSG